MKKSKILFNIFFSIIIAIVVNLLLGFFFSNDISLATIKSLSWTNIIIGLVFQMLVVCIDSIRTRIVLLAWNMKLAWKDCFANSMAGWFLNAITPMAAGGQPFQIYHLKQLGLSSKISTNVILSRFITTAVLSMVFLVLGFPVLLQLLKVIPGGVEILIIGLTTTLVLTLLLLFTMVNPTIIGKLALKSRHSKLGKLIGRVTKKPRWGLDILVWTHSLRNEIIHLWVKNPVNAITDILLNTLLILIQTTGLYLILINQGIRELAYWTTTVLYVTIWQVVFYIPTPGSSGGVEGLFVLVFGEITNSIDSILIGVFEWRLGSYYSFIIVGLIFFTILTKKIQTKAKQ